MNVASFKNWINKLVLGYKNDEFLSVRVLLLEKKVFWPTILNLWHMFFKNIKVFSPTSDILPLKVCVEWNYVLVF